MGREGQRQGAEVAVKLIIQPEAGVVPITHAIKTAKKSIDVFIFRFDRDDVEKALAAAVQRGVTVRALIAHTNRGGEIRLRKLEQRLLAAGVLVSRSADDLLRYHAKYLISDSTLHLLGFNFTKLDIDKSRSFAVATRDHRSVQAARALFEADLSRQPYAAGKSNLVVSPDNAREQLSAFIKGARKELAIYDAKAFVGSQSLRKDELENRREVGLIVKNPAVARKLLQVFESDWQASAKGRNKDDQAADAA